MIYGLFVFVVAFLTDVVWAHYTMAAAAKKAARASFFATTIALTGLVGWDAYHRSYWYVVPFGLGCAVGTYLAVRREARVAI